MGLFTGILWLLAILILFNKGKLYEFKCIMIIVKTKKSFIIYKFVLCASESINILLKKYFWKEKEKWIALKIYIDFLNVMNI